MAADIARAARDQHGILIDHRFSPGSVTSAKTHDTRPVHRGCQPMVRPRALKTPRASLTPFAGLTPDAVLDAAEQVGLEPDGHVFALNSYENRVYRLGRLSAPPVVLKF